MLMRVCDGLFTNSSAWCRYETQVVKQLIVNDGGSGSFVEVRPEVLGIFDTLLTVRVSTGL